MSIRITDLGLHVLPYKDIYEALKAEYLVVDSGLDMSPSSLDGNKLAIDAAALFEVQSMFEELVHVLDANSAEGVHLLNLVSSLAGGIFQRGSFSKCDTIVFTGTAGAKVLTGEKLIDDNGQYWTTTTSGIVGDNIHAICDKIGKVVLGAGKINKMISYPSGITGVSNTGAVVAGIETDTNSVIRRKLMKASAGFNRNGDDALYSELGRVNGVFDLVIEDNRSSLVVDNLAAHSVACIVHGGVDQELLDAVARSISSGVGMNTGNSALSNEVTGNGNTLSSRQIICSVFRATEVPISIVITVDGMIADPVVTDDIKAMIVGYFNGDSHLLPLNRFDQNGLLIGEDVYSFRIATPVNAVLAGTGHIQTITLNGSDTVTIPKRSIATVTESNITVNYV